MSRIGRSGGCSPRRVIEGSLLIDESDAAIEPGVVPKMRPSPVTPKER
jgi:hypothetical protein